MRKGYKPPEGSPEGVPFSEASSRAKRSEAPAERRSEAPAERSEAFPPSEARPREGHREVAITKKLKNYKKDPPESPGEPLIFFFPKKTRVVKVPGS